ncbi:uncharacterized protein Z518_03943 [Rhinocladiella mackenziei CBS 650.93]|uniref:Rhinocladiella mackenziei CBS 650.93 unplaced genomic scaffold supercont1.3, whole genome shotgun sequence n=1 Tax=Rhinocladiella mackenziei CBS 650.93 TaxID=1442369 RepID=A0A0D2IJU0_9EURO|nr:uncharacterized protein Z518_03943 [Rhinocladiella mackenziei CBS 650.93]KIX05969.1 hypothetical protein Z518_03943 [Rhinocladiella mackenziei CBS 650.93]
MHYLPDRWRPSGPLQRISLDVQIDSLFAVDERDIVVQKTRWYAGAGNSWEQILRAQNIDTVVIVCNQPSRPNWDRQWPLQSGLSLSRVVMSTVYRLFDLDSKVYVISDNVLELPVDQNADFSKVLLDTPLPKMSLNTISVEDALLALGGS